MNISNTFLTVVFVLLPSVAVASCPCPPKSVGEKYENSQAVFQGLLQKVVELPGEPRLARLTFSLEKSWKGTGLPEQDVTIPVSVDACGLSEEQVGLSYLVYARAGTDGTLQTSICDGTDLSDALQSDVKLLDQIYHPETSVSDRFPDVPTDHPYQSAIADFRRKSIISGFPDGTLRPEWSLTRAEAVKILTLVTQEYLRTYDESAYENRRNPFSDTDSEAWYYPSLLRSVHAGYINGFADGTFRPSQSVTVAEALSMVTKAFDIESPDLGAVWYERFVRSIAGLSALPVSIRAQSEPIKRGELIEMLWRIANHIQNRPSLTAENLLTKECVDGEDSFVPKVDMRRVRIAWLGLYNDVRTARGLTPYRLDPHLNRSSAIWSKRSADKGVMEHKRSSDQVYYDYSAIVSWFRDLGLEFENMNGITFTENIGRGPYVCSSDDCTDVLISALRSTFDFYMGEEPKEYRPHFRAIVNSRFEIMGVGIAVQNGQYYITTHFGTKITSDPPRLCASEGL